MLGGYDNSTFNIALVCDQYLKYASFDALIFNGVTWWQNWVNARGGLYYDGSYHQVVIISKDASNSNPNLTVSTVKSTYLEMLQDNYVNLIVSPYSGDRTNAAIAVSERYAMINLVPASLVDSQFTNTSSYIFTNAVPSKKVLRTSLSLLVAKGIKNYIIIRRPDSVSQLLGQNAVDYLTSVGILPLATYWMNSTSSDVGQITTALRAVMNQALVGATTDLFIYAGSSTEFSTVATIFNEIASSCHINAAVCVNTLSRYEPTIDQVVHVTDYWLSTTRFDKDFNYGVSGQLGGTTAEFVSNFTAEFGHPPTTYDAVAPALLMAYYVAVNLTQSVDHDVIMHTMKTMGRIDTFASPILFQANGTNALSPISALQIVDGEGRLATVDNLIYPAPFAASKQHLNTKVIVAIVLPVGAVVIAMVAFGVLYMHRQRKQVVKALVQAEEGERRNYRIDYSSLTLGEPIGTGGFGVVFKGEYRGADVAIKKLKSQVMNKTQLEEFAKESAVMIGLRHPNILLFMGVCLDPPDLAIITEFMPRGSLYDVIHNDKISLPFPLIKNMAIDILKGLHFIHSAGIIHRDLKSPNLLVDKSWNIKIADFGLSVMKAESNDDAQVSLLWTAPEILMKQQGCYTDKSDVYSFAIILWELMSRQTPFSSFIVAAISPAVVGGQRPPIDSKWDEQISNLITMCWASSPHARPSVKEARATAEKIYADPNFELGSSSSLQNYVEKVQPPVGQVTFVFTSVCNTAQLWDHDPHVMMRSLILHNEIMRDLVQKHSGYEVKSNGDSFLFAFADPINATNFCLSAQSALLDAEWSDILLKHSCAAVQKGQNGEIVFRGLAVNMGIHTTNATIERTAGSTETNYFGTEVGVAGLLSTFATKGCIAMGPEMYAKAMASTMKLNTFTIGSLGARKVLGKHCDVYQMCPKALANREEIDYGTTETGTLDDCFSETSTAKFQFPLGEEAWLVRYEDVVIGEKIGSGSFGEVKLGNYKGQKVAVKQLLKQKMTDTALLEMRAESAMLSSLTHPNVLQFVGVCLRVPNLCLITEYMEKGSLRNVLHPATGQCTLSWDQKKKMALDMAKGMHYLHSIGIIHRDIKSSNMLVANDFTVKIADFGYSRMRADNQTMTQVGTVSYSAPEVFEGLHYTNKADVYSFAIVMWELIFNKKAWDGMHSMKIVAAVTSGGRPPVTSVPPGAPPSMVRTMQMCWNHDQDLRPSFMEILNELERP